jgi:FHA domain
MHATSSRRHAMLFHHSNGSCYVVDCGSAHGTFVNGKRIAVPAESGVVVPQKVRRGALIRFGGPGAPCFVLKSLPVHLHNIKSDSKLSDEALLVLSNTRMNALGKSTPEVVRSSIVTASIYQALAVVHKRSFDSLSGDTLDFESDGESECKRMRCSSPPLSPEAPLRLVSPDLPAMIKPRRVSFAIDDTFFYPPTISPDESCEEDNDDSLV